MNETEQNLLEVWNNWVNIPVELEYRIYYNVLTGETTRTDVARIEVAPYDEPYITVDKEIYNTFNSYTHIVVNGELVDRPKHTAYARSMAKTDNGEYTTMRNRSMFPIDNQDTETDRWGLRSNGD